MGDTPRDDLEQEGQDQTEELPQESESIQEESREVETEGTEIPEADGSVDGGEHEGGEEAEVPESTEPKYRPDFSYQVLDESHEIPEEFHKFIQSKEDEERMRDLFARAHGLDVVKQDRQELRSQNMELQQVEHTRQQAVQQLQDFVQKGDLKPFMETWGITDDVLANYMMQRIKLQEMDPAQRAQFEQAEQARLQNYQLHHQNQMMQQRNSQLQGQQLSHQVDLTLGSPEFAGAVQAYDQRMGAGAFKRELANLGEFYYTTQNGRMVPPNDLARELVQKFGWQEPSEQHAIRDTRPGGSRQDRRNRVVTKDRKPTLPNVRGSGTSPVKGQVKSIEDIRKKAQQYASGG